MQQHLLLLFTLRVLLVYAGPHCCFLRLWPLWALEVWNDQPFEAEDHKLLCVGFTSTKMLCLDLTNLLWCIRFKHRDAAVADLAAGWTECCTAICRAQMQELWILPSIGHLMPTGMIVNGSTVSKRVSCGKTGAGLALLLTTLMCTIVL